MKCCEFSGDEHNSNTLLVYGKGETKKREEIFFSDYAFFSFNDLFKSTLSNILFLRERYHPEMLVSQIQQDIFSSI